MQNQYTLSTETNCWRSTVKGYRVKGIEETDIPVTDSDSDFEFELETLPR